MDIPECLGEQGYVCGIVKARDQVHVPRRHGRADEWCERLDLSE